MFVSSNHTDICGLLNDIRLELEKQLSAKTNREIHMDKIFQLSDLIPNRIMTTNNLPKGATDALNILSHTLYDNATTHANLQLRLDDVNKLLALLCP